MRVLTRSCVVLVISLICECPCIAERFVIDQGIAGWAGDGTVDIEGGGLRDGIFGLQQVNLFGLAIAHRATAELRSALEFPLAGAPSGATIDRAVIAFPTFSTNSGNEVPIGVDGYLGDGVLNNEDFAPDNRLAVLTLPDKFGVQGPVSIEVTDFIKELLSFEHLQVTHAGFAFRQLTVSDAASSTLVLNFPIPDQPHASLIIDYTPANVPEPSGIVLAVCGAAVSVVALRRRRCS